MLGPNKQTPTTEAILNSDAKTAHISEGGIRYIIMSIHIDIYVIIFILTI